MGLLQKIFGNKNQRELKKLQPLVVRINDLEPRFEKMTNEELRAVTGELKGKLVKGATLDDILPEAFAVVREGGKRALGMRHYDVQLIGGMVLHRGRIAEMRTGEGKTLVATLPAYLNALSGKGVHVVTVNDYLARRDAEWMGRLYGFLGLTTGVVVHGIDDVERQHNYNCDITYGQNNEFGFDYLRDNMKTAPDRMVQRALNYAIVDEVDSILIDEARTPLIISGAGEASADLYDKVDKLIPRLKRDVDFTVDEKERSVILTDDGVERIESLLEVDNLYEANNIQLVHHVNQALRAHTLYKRNVNYLVQEGKVIIVDEHTGRTMPGRRWSDGLHQAIEAKEGVTVEEENQTVATVTFQNYFRMYKKLSGMTGTADTEAAEFHQIYKLDVSVIPTNKPIRRKDLPDLVYKEEAGKFRAVITDIEDCHKRGQPVLVGTVSVEKSEVVANLLKAKGLAFNVLNAKQHLREASIVAQAGRKGAITISTNMAGRGTDILLGGNPEAMAKEALTEEKSKLAESAAQAEQPADGGPASEDGEEASPYRGSSVPAFDEEARLAELVTKFKQQCEEERKQVLEAGGLKIIGTERHESRRIDNQLRGRAGRQGDPGTSRFYLSMQDDLLRIFGLDRMTGWMERLGLEDDVPIESPMVTRSIENAQKKVEGRNFDYRKNVLEYDDVMNQQRRSIYATRRQILEGRYHREATEEEKKLGIVPEPVKESGDWTQALLTPEVKPKLVELIDAIKARQVQIEADLAIGKPVADPRPAWRVLRSEIWRQYGTLIPDLEKAYEATESLADLCTYAVTASMIQQRERLYDLADQRIIGIIGEMLSPDQNEDQWDWDALEEALGEQFSTEEMELTPGTADEVAGQAWKHVEKLLGAREKELTRPWLLYFARHFALEEIDQQWMEHLRTMDALRDGIGLQGYGQKDPKKEYKKAGYALFAEMMSRIQANTVSKVFRVQFRREEEQVPTLAQKERQLVERGVADKSDDDGGDTDAAAGTETGTPRASKAKAGAPAARAAASPAEAKVETVRRDRPKVGRNDPCPCGSGKKYKKCHGRDEADAAQE
ncbi:MAG: preprotein translocase subunit SecA [Myxococcales bacterium]|nr:preprotein translocase subunit SecA [Myxococcales bacterium]